jgi:hypothetical protein
MTSAEPKPFVIDPNNWVHHRNHNQEFAYLVENINVIDHGEFDAAARRALKEAERHGESQERPAALALQRCRRGGKTFMLYAVASKLSFLTDSDTHVLFVSLNNDTPYEVDEKPLDAILARIAYEYSGASGPFYKFVEMYRNYDSVENWLENKKVILLIDELNVVSPDADGYWKMTKFLNLLVNRQGSALIYSTHLRDTKDLLRNRGRDADIAALSMRRHVWLSIPRIVNEECLLGLNRTPFKQPSFWCAVLRGRLPALMIQSQDAIEEYGNGIFGAEATDEDRTGSLAAVITGNISNLPNQRRAFRAYSYMSERYKSDYGQEPKFAWPPFLVAQKGVLGKDCTSLCSSLEDPSIDEAKAFEALVQLAVLVRLMSAQHHYLVPSSQLVTESNSYKSTEIIHLHERNKSIPDILEAVTIEFKRRPQTLQVVAVPFYSSFPLYDFFVLHREDKTWKIAAGYQCKQGTERPTEIASPIVPLSVWVEGKCRKYRVSTAGNRVPVDNVLGWEILGTNRQNEMLGVSISEALPEEQAKFEKCCPAAMESSSNRDCLHSSNFGSFGSSEDSTPPLKKHRSQEQ